MTVAALSDPRSVYTGDGVSTSFLLGFPLKDDLSVSVDGVAVAYSLSVDKTSVVLDPAPATGAEIEILRQTVSAQNTDFTDNGPFPADDVEDGLDRLHFIAQELRGASDRLTAFLKPVLSVNPTNALLLTSAAGVLAAYSMGAPLDRAGKLVAFDAAGAPVAATVAEAVPALSDILDNIDAIEAVPAQAAQVADDRVAVAAALAAAQIEREKAVAAANAAIDAEFHIPAEDYAGAVGLIVAGTLQNGDEVMIYRDEQYYNRRTLRRNNNGVLSGVLVDFDRVKAEILSTDFGFIHGDDSVAALNENDTLFAQLTQLAAQERMDFAVAAGEVHHRGTALFHDLRHPFKGYAVGADAGLTCRELSKHTLRARGRLTGENAPTIEIVGLRLKNAWTAANSWQAGNPVYSGGTAVAGEPNWEGGCCLAVTRARKVIIRNNVCEDAAYDGIALTQAIESGVVVGNKVKKYRDDGINLGGNLGPDYLGPLGVYNVRSIGNIIEEGEGVGLHMSGGNGTNVSHFDMVEWAGRAPIDIVHTKAIVRGFIGVNIGQLDASDPEYVNRPGGVGFNQAVPASGFVAQAGYERADLDFDIQVFNLFDGQGRAQKAFDLALGTDVIRDSRFKFRLDNSGVDATYYSNNNIKPIDTGVANNTRFTRTDIRLSAKATSTNRFNRFDAHHQGRTNKIWIDIEHGNGGQINGEKLKVKKLRAIDCGTVNVFSANTRFWNVNCENNSHISATTYAYGLSIAAADVSFRNCASFKNCGVTYTSAGLRPQFRFGVDYVGEAGQRPALFGHNLGGDGARYRNVNVVQAVLDGGVTAGDLIWVRRPSVRLSGLSGKVDMTTGLIWRTDAATATNCGLRADFLEYSCRYIFESVAAAGNMFTGEVWTHYTGGNDVTLRSAGAIENHTVRRLAANTNAFVNLAADASIIACGRGTGFGANPYVNGTTAGTNNSTAVIKTV
jgi:hypothetical protein